MKKTFKLLSIVFILISSFCFNFQSSININAKENKQINIYLFHGKECPHCHDMIDFLNKYVNENNDLTLTTYEIWHNDDNANKYNQARLALNDQSNGVPYLVIGNKVIIGFREGSTDQEIKEYIDYYRHNNYVDVVGNALGLIDDNGKIKTQEQKQFFNLPILGRIDAKKASLPLIAMIIGFVDGFNPCAMWILIFLITMLFGMNDHKKMWILGLTFLFTSAIVYLLFMISWLNLSLFMSKIIWIRIGIAVFAIAFGCWNIYKYLKDRKDDVGCDVVDDNQRMSIINKIKKIVTEKSFILALLGVMTLAISVNIIELLCSLGLPVVFTQILSLNNLSHNENALYLGIYIFFFLLDDLIIFFIAMKTLSIKAISNKYTKYSHLIGGLIMLVIGLLMAFAPQILMFSI